ncbi:MAG: cyclic 2,3-diphosphoglycerate synthase [Lentisphaeria bacterium]|nr:cyclic 2,3-diphosphoglycerate synthase [Candidatus Neomarinimicrobiota bacterium]MCF7841239.1 cyclic 2,3-diphosphoglycerate synthase [Lentisphaeria bacterium]
MNDERIRVIIMGAAGRDFHNFNVYYRDNPAYEIVAFTATQIPDIDDRKYPAELAGALYPDGIPIYSEDDLEELIDEMDIDEVVFAYSDVSYDTIMHKSALVNAAGADFRMMGAKSTMLKSEKPVIAVCAVRTGCGKSQTTRRLCDILKAQGKKVVAIRHPMPYGDLVKQKVQRFATLEDLKKHDCTIEEMEEYEPHIMNGTVVYAGVDYEAILREAEKEADVIVWDGGNNDMPFYIPDMMITVVDPHRPGHEISYYPGETNLMMADVVVINKMDTANMEGIQEVRDSIDWVNPEAVVIDAASPIYVDDPDVIRNARVLVVEDGPTLTHGEMTYGAGVVAADKFGAAELVDPRPFTVGKITETFEKYEDIGDLLPAMGYGAEQMKDLETTIANTDCDAVIIGTPIDLRRVIKIDKPSTRVMYKLQEIGEPTLESIISNAFKTGLMK